MFSFLFLAVGLCIAGSIPKELGTLTELHELCLSCNQLTGKGAGSSFLFFRTYDAAARTFVPRTHRRDAS